MKVLEVRQASRYGNLERLIIENAVCLQPRGYDIDILLLYNRNRARLLGEDAATLPEVHPLISEAEQRGIRAWQEEDDHLLSPRLLRTLLRAAKSGGYDLLHTHDVKTDVLGLLVSRMTGIPVLASAHGYPRAIRRNDVYRLVDLLALRWFPNVICVSAGLRHELQAGGLEPGRLSVVYNGIAASEILQKATATPHTLRSDLNIRPKEVVLMSVGRLSSEKGHTYLLQATQRVLQSHPNVRLVMVGEGPLQDQLAREAVQLGIAERVVFLGFRTDALALIAQSDIVINPSLKEALGNVVLEAMALSRPVVGTTAGGMHEVIRAGESGLITSPADSEALAAAILQLIDDPHRAKLMGECGRDLVLQSFTVERMAEGLAQVFLACSKRRQIQNSHHENSSSLRRWQFHWRSSGQEAQEGRLLGAGHRPQGA